MRKEIFCKVVFFLIVFLSFSSSYAQVSNKTHGITLSKALKYSENFKHFNYVDPDSPKTGRIVLSAPGTFDSVNPYIVMGDSAQGMELVFATLMAGAEDDLDAQYGYLAQAIDVAPDRSSVTFYLRDATFHDGSKINASDVKFSFDILREKGKPQYRQYYDDVERAEVISNSVIRFVIKNKNNRELPAILGQLPVFSQNYYKDKKFEEATLTSSVGSGPYKVKSVDPGKTIIFERVKKWWGESVNVNVGLYNFDEIEFVYFRDPSVMFEAFKAGKIDFRLEAQAKTWATEYRFPAVKDGRVVVEEVEHQLPPGMQGLFFNTRKKTFENRDVRLAISELFDFEMLNKTIFSNGYTRTSSFFERTDFAAKGLPSEEEKKLLLNYHDMLPKELFEKEYVPPQTKGDGNIRDHLTRAQDLLKKAGYRFSNGILVDSNNQPLSLEILINHAAFERVLSHFVANLKRLGVQATIKLVDASQYQRQIEDFDYDMIVHRMPPVSFPGNEQEFLWSSKAAAMRGSQNFSGVKNPIIDELIEKIIVAKNHDEHLYAVRALDRVLLWNAYVIPMYYNNVFRIAHWYKFSKPKVRPHYGLGLYSWSALPPSQCR